MPPLALTDKPIGPIGYGLMGLTWRAQPPSQSQAFSAMTQALASGANFWNGGELYGSPERNSCHLLKEYFDKYPEKRGQVVLSIKGGLKRGELVPDGGERNVRRSVEDCLAVLGGSIGIDVFECARVDHNVPIEETVGVLKMLKEEGKIGGVGLSEVSAKTIERAAKVCEIAAVEVELSLWATDILRNGVAEVCGRLGIVIVAYSPLSRGALPGEIVRKVEDLPEGDVRRRFPKWQDDVLEQNNRLTEEVERLARRKGVSMPQVAIAWVRGLSGRTVPTGDGGVVKMGTVVPIPGATTKERVEENSTLVELSDEEMEEIADIIKKNPIKGLRYPEQMMAHCEG